MNDLTTGQTNTIVELLKEGKPLPEEYRWLLFEGKQETELIYAGKMREVDVLTETMAVPLQRTKTFGDVKDDQWHNMLIFGDNLQILKTLIKMKEDGKLKNPDGVRGVKLIYIDPPFGTGDIYGKGDVGAYSAKLIGAKYLEWLRQRIILLKGLLSEDGSLYMRSDYHFGYYMKIILDEIMGRENFINELVVKRGKVQFGSLNKYTVATDSLFWYSKTEAYLFNKFRRARYEHEPKRTNMILRGEREPRERVFLDENRNKHILLPPPDTHFKFIQGTIDEMTAKGLFSFNKSRKGLESGFLENLNGKWVKTDLVPSYIFDMDKAVDSNWTDIPGYSQYWGYPTENSEQLLERVVRTSSEPGDIVLDAFGGSGTTGVVAEKLGRRWIMIDSSKFAIYTMVRRMLNLKQQITNKGKVLKANPFAVYGAGLYDMKILKELPFNEYRDFALQLFQCKDEPHKLAGIELDGFFGQDHVLVFKWKKNSDKKNEYVIDRGFVENIHSILGDRTGKRFLIIAPAASVLFLEDYIEKDNTRYYVLRIPYSIIDELHKKNFKLLEQPLSVDISEVNKVMEQIGFDFIYPPNIECEYYVEKQKGKLFPKAVIKIKKFRSNIVSKKPIPEEELGFKALSIVIVDYDYNGECFDMDEKWFASELQSTGYEIRFDPDNIREKMMIIYMDVYGNERKEVKTPKDFRRRD